MSQWMDLWAHTHQNGIRTEWPDGRSLMDQPNITVRVMALVEDGISKAEAPAVPA